MRHSDISSSNDTFGVAECSVGDLPIDGKEKSAGD